MAFENFTTYTEVDEEGTIQKNATTVWGSIDTNVDTYVYKDLGAGHFGNFEHLHENDVALIDPKGYNGLMFVWGVTNTVDDGGHWAAGMAIHYQYIGETHKYQITLADMPLWGNFEQWLNIAAKRYYFKTSRSGTTGTSLIYDDSGRTNLVKTLTCTVANTTYRYIYAMTSRDEGVAGIDISFEIEKLDLQEAAGDVGADIFFWDGSARIELVKDDTSPVKLFNGTVTIGIKLVATDHADASAIHVFDGVNIKAFKKKV